MFTVGEFSKICQVSVKTLHHYDRIDLLKPAKVDVFTGYRYYDQKQVKKMLLIQRLKRYGFSLEEIRSFLTCDNENARFLQLKNQKEQLIKQMYGVEQIIREISVHLQDFERTGDSMSYQKKYEIQLQETPKRAVLSCRNMMGVDEFGKYYSSLYERVPTDKVTPNGETGAIYHDKEFNRESSDIELFVGIREMDKADTIMEPALCAMTIHKGSYSSLSDAYGALIAWMEEHGYEHNGSPYDIYVKSGFDRLPVEEWETHVYFPVKKK